MKLAMQLTLTVLVLALSACSKSNQDQVIRPSGDLVTNGPGVGGSIHENTKIFLVLKKINDGQTYTLRTSIGQTLLSNETTTVDGTLSVNIYESQDAYINSATAVASAVSASSPYEYVYEAVFKARSAGDYVAVVSGKSISTPGIQFFYDLRLMSADQSVDQSVLTSFETPTITDLPASTGVLTPLIINPGSQNVFSGSTITPPGTYSIKLTSDSTTTLGYPQLFVYRDSTLSMGSLLYSGYTTLTDFIVTQFDVTTGTKGTSTTLVTDLTSGMTITGITFSDKEPFIVVKGIISTPSYSLTIGP